MAKEKAGDTHVGWSSRVLGFGLKTLGSRLSRPLPLSAFPAVPTLTFSPSPMTIAVARPLCEPPSMRKPPKAASPQLETELHDPRPFALC